VIQRSRRIAAQLLFGLALGSPAAAIAQTWIGGSGPLWSTAANWVPSPPSGGPTTQVVMAGPGPSLIDGLYTLNGIQVTVGGMNLGGLPVTFAGGGPYIDNQNVGTVVSNDLFLNALFTITTTFPMNVSGQVNGMGAGMSVSGTDRVTFTNTVGFVGTIVINPGATAAFTGTASLGAVIANGALELAVPGGVTLASPVTGSGTATIAAGSAIATLQQAGTTTIAPASSLAGAIDNNALLSLDGTFDTGGATVGSLAGSGQLNVNSGTFVTGGDGTSTLFIGDVAGPGDLVKNGAGTLTLAGATLNLGTLTANGGTLALGDGAGGPMTAITLVTNASLELNVPSPAGIGVTDPVTGTGSLSVTGGFAAIPFAQHLGTTTVAAGARLDGGITNGALFTLDGEHNTGGGDVGALAGAATGQLNINGGLFVAGSNGASTTFLGAVNGPGDLTKVGTGTLTIAGTSLNTGTITISAGTLAVGNGAAGPSSIITLVNDGALELAVPLPIGVGITNPVTGSGSVAVTAGLAVAPFLQHTGTTTVLSGARLDGGITNNARFTLDGIFNTGGAAVGSLAGAASGQLNINSGAFSTGGDNTSSTFAGAVASAGDLVKTGTGTLTLSGTSTNTGTMTVQGGTLAVSGTSMSSVVVNGPGATLRVTGSIFNPVTVTQGTLMGTGTISFPVSVAAPATLAPGLTSGILNTASLNLSGNYTAEILGPTAGTQHDQVNVTGTVTLNNPTLTLAGAHVLAPADVIVLIANDGADAVVGTFAGLPEGATLVFNGRTLRISYVGGTGNDVVLSLATFTVTPSAGANGTISPGTPQTVASGSTTTFTVTPGSGYTAVVGGTCGGTLVGNTYTTNAITANCTVAATFTLVTYTVTPSAGANGTIAPGTPQTIGHGATTTFTVTPNAGYTASVGGTCGGTLAGNTYTTNAITANCTVVATFTPSAVTTFSGPTATGSGTATASFTGGGPTCTFAVAQLIPVTGHAASPPAGTAPTGIAFPHGLFDFRLANCTPGATITMTMTYPQALPAGTQYWKYGPTPADATPHWYVLAATITGNSAVFSITDGSTGDDDLAANGSIVDQGGPGVPPPAGPPVPTPTLSQWMLIVLAALLLLTGWREQGWRPVPSPRRRRRT
jgi:autotransporter-associated beta strand protein